MIDWWQNLPSQMSPVMFSLGAISIHWYSVMYIVAFAVTYFLLMNRIKKDEITLTKDQIGDFATWAILGTILGGRLGYVLFYDFGYFISHPLEIFLPIDPETGAFTGISGMSYHGGAAGVIISSWLYARKNSLGFLKMIDTIVPAVPIAYTFGRIGNFINGELYGRVTSLSLGMYFPSAPTVELRHASQLYEALFEGIILFAILWPLRNKFNDKPGSLIGIYLIGYGVFRFFIEFAREPDAHLGFVFLSFSMGQLLCFSMIIIGTVFMVLGKKFKNMGVK